MAIRLAQLHVWLDREPLAAAGLAVDALRARLAEPGAAARVVHPTPRGGAVVRLPVGGGPRRVLEFDRHGTLVAALAWRADALGAAWTRLPDRSWLRIEPRATSEAPWGASDRLWHAGRLGDPGRAVTVFEAVDYTRVDRIPTLAEPGRLPPGGGTAVLNLLAALALDQGVAALAYRGPYPTEQLFLALLESFQPEPADAPDPLAAFVGGELVWRPAPHERLFTPAGAYVQARARVEKVVWEGRTYYRPDWPGVVRHAPRRVRDEGEAVRCSLWALGTVVEDHLELSREGEVRQVWTPAAGATAPRPLPAAVTAGVAAIVASTSAPPLAPFVAAAARSLALEWGAVPGDLIEVAGDRVRVSDHLRALLAARLAGAPASRRAALGLAALTELALLLGDTLRARAQARMAALPADRQAEALAAPPPADPGRARAIAEAGAALAAAAG